MEQINNRPMAGKTVLVTGGTGGIGIAQFLVLRARTDRAVIWAPVVALGRNPAKCADVVREIKHSSGNNAVEALIADLSIMAEVQHVADEFFWGVFYT